MGFNGHRQQNSLRISIRIALLIIVCLAYMVIGKFETYSMFQAKVESSNQTFLKMSSLSDIITGFELRPTNIDANSINLILVDSSKILSEDMNINFAIGDMVCSNLDKESDLNDFQNTINNYFKLGFNKDKLYGSDPEIGVSILKPNNQGDLNKLVNLFETGKRSKNRNTIVEVTIKFIFDDGFIKETKEIGKISFTGQYIYNQLSK